MHYLKFGNSKKYIVFLHGWGADLNSFLWLKDYFESDYSLLFLDFLGFGKSDDPKSAMSVSDYAFELKKLLDSFEIDELNIVAHSFGGRVAIKFLFFFQNNYSKTNLCLVDSAGMKPRRSLLYYIKIARFKKLKKKSLTNKSIESKLLKSGSSDYRKLNFVMKETFKLVVNEDLSCFAKFIACRTIIIWGEKDKETKLFMAKKLHRLIPGSKLVILKNSGHFCFLEKKEDFVIILDTFLKNL